MSDLINAVLNASPATPTTDNPFRSLKHSEEGSGGCAGIAFIAGLSRLIADTESGSWTGHGWEIDAGQLTVEAIRQHLPEMVCKIEHGQPTIELDGREIIVPNVLAAIARFGDRTHLIDGFRADERRPIFQPMDTLQMMEDAVKKHGGHLATYGYLFGGSVLFASARMNEFDIAGQRNTTYFNVSDGFTGSRAYAAGMHHHAQVCRNTVAMAFGNSAKAKHTLNAEAKVNQILKDLELGVEIEAEKREKFEAFNRIECNDPTGYLQTVLNSVSDRLNFPTFGENVASIEADDNLTIKQKAAAITKFEKGEEKRDSLLEACLTAYNGERYPRNLWGAFNAVTEVATHGNALDALATDEDAKTLIGRTNKTDTAADRAFLQRIGLGNSASERKPEEIKEAAYEAALTYLEN